MHWDCICTKQLPQEINGGHKWELRNGLSDEGRITLTLATRLGETSAEPNYLRIIW